MRLDICSVVKSHQSDIFFINVNLNDVERILCASYLLYFRMESSRVMALSSICDVRWSTFERI